MLIMTMMMMVMHFYRLPSQRSQGVLHSSTIKDSHRQKNLFSCALYKEKAIQLYEHKRKSIPLDEGGNGIFTCSGFPPANSCMIYLGQSKWPEDRKKIRKPIRRVTKKTSFRHYVTILAEGRVLRVSKIAAWSYYV